jgi:hypothetical protein
MCFPLNSWSIPDFYELKSSEAHAVEFVGAPCVSMPRSASAWISRAKKEGFLNFDALFPVAFPRRKVLH